MNIMLLYTTYLQQQVFNLDYHHTHHWLIKQKVEGDGEKEGVDKVCRLWKVKYGLGFAKGALRCH